MLAFGLRAFYFERGITQLQTDLGGRAGMGVVVVEREYFSQYRDKIIRHSVWNNLIKCQNNFMIVVGKVKFKNKHYFSATGRIKTCSIRIYFQTTSL